MSNDLDDLLLKIDQDVERHLELSKAMLKADGRKFFALDLLAVAVINRSLSNCNAFSLLVRERNYLAAASLVRLQLDSFLRFYAAYLVEEPHQFAASVLGGKAVRNLKDRSGVRMTDRYLVESVAKEYPWVPSVYKSTSGFIHLSDKHIFSTIESVTDDGKFAVRISADADRFPVSHWVEMTEGFIAATDAQFRFLKGWVITKGNPQLIAAVQEHANES